MFKKLIKSKYDGCDTIQQYLDIRKELKKTRFSVKIYQKDLTGVTNVNNVSPYKTKIDFSKELLFLKNKHNVFDKMILGKVRDNYIDNGEFILTFDRFDSKEHYLLIPKNISYFNVLTLEKKDVKMLKNMKEFVNQKYDNKVMYFHCYPFNSVHTLHLHIVDSKNYIHRKNNLFIDDVIYALENENKLVLGFIDLEKVYQTTDQWFKDHSLSLLNIYVLSLILIEANTGDVREKNRDDRDTRENKNTIEDKKHLIPYAIDFILDFLVEKHKLEDKEKILEYFEDEKETLENIGELMLEMCKKPYLLQKRCEN